MILPMLGGVAWGLLAAGIHLAHLRRTIRRRLGDSRSAPIGRIQAASLLRILLVGGTLYAGTRVEWVRMDACLITYAIAHLILTIGYGVRLSRDEANPETGESKKEVGLLHG